MAAKNSRSSRGASPGKQTVSVTAEGSKSKALVPATAPQSVGDAVDDMGRALAPAARPIIGSMFTPRFLDRHARVRSPWTAEKIIAALDAAEWGDMGPQADLSEAMQDGNAAILAFRQTRILPPAKLAWSCEPADDSPLAKEIADFVTSEIKSIPNFLHAKRDTFSAVDSGIAALWVDWQLGGRSHGGEAPKSKYRIDGIHFISPKRYRFHWMEERFLILPDWAFGKAQEIGLMQPSAGPTMFSQLANAGLGVEPPPWKCIIHRSRVKSGHPAKAGIARTCARHFYFQLVASQNALVFSEIFGMPLRVGKYPPGTSDPEKAELAAGLESLGSDAMAICSTAMEIEFLESKSRTGGGAPFFEILAWSERQVQLAWCGQDQTNTHNPTGGRTQVAEGGAPIRQDLLEADCIDVETTYTMQLCKPIVGFSKYGWELAAALCPTFKIRYELKEDRNIKATTLKTIHIDLKVPWTYAQAARELECELPDGFTDGDVIIDYSTVPAAIPPAATADRNAPAGPPITPAPKKKPLAAGGYAERLAALPPSLRAWYGGNFAAETADSTESYDFASAQVNITGAVASQVLELAAGIPDDALAEKGREDTPHVTACFGIDPAVTIEELRPIIGPRAAGSLTLGPTAFFAAPDYDVVFLTVESPDLVALNKAIREGVKTTETHPNYVPHLTLAYVESGRGHEFAGNGSMHGVKFAFTSVYYSDVDGNLRKIQAIRGHVRVTAPKAKLATYEPKFYQEGDAVPDGWPEGSETSTARATFETLSMWMEREPDEDRRQGMDADRELIRRDEWVARFADADGGDYAKLLTARDHRAEVTANLSASGQSAIDNLQQEVDARAKSIIGSLVMQARDVCLGAKTLAEIPELLRAAFPDLDAKPLATLTARTVFAARLNGRASAKRTPPPKVEPPTS